MPTGYTCYIEDGKINNAKDFLMLCARAFGACIEMRDESFETPIPKEFEPDDYHLVALKDAKAELTKWESMSIEEAQKLLDEEYNSEIEDIKKHITKDKNINNRYKDILEQIKNWDPPTSEHINLKKFAIEQIEMCMDDFNNSYWLKEINKPKQNVSKWLAEKIKVCKGNIKYHEDGYKSEVERVNKRNKWIRELRDSLS